jgi:hypothetical protein
MQRKGEGERFGIFGKILLLEMVDHILEQMRSGLRVAVLDLLQQIDKRWGQIDGILQLLLG